MEMESPAARNKIGEPLPWHAASYKSHKRQRKGKTADAINVRRLQQTSQTFIILPLNLILVQAPLQNSTVRTEGTNNK